MIIMSRLSKNRCWWIVVCVLCAKACFAQAPSGDFDFSFDASFDPIINMSGTFQSDQSIIGAGGTETPLTISVDITNAVTGGLKGAGFGIVQVGNDVLGASYTANGRVSGGGGAPTRVVLSVKLTGTGTVSGVQGVAFTITLRYNLVFNSETATLDGTCRGGVSFQKIGSGSVRSDISVAVPSGSDGTWRLHLSILPLNPIGGTGQIITSEGRTVPGIVHGSFQPGLGRTVINLTGTQEGVGMAAHLILLNGETGVELQRATGHVLGQRINFSF